MARRGSSHDRPYALDFTLTDVGKKIKTSKKRARWLFRLPDDTKDREITLYHSITGGKKKLCSRDVYEHSSFSSEHIIHEESKFSAADWSHSWQEGQSTQTYSRITAQRESCDESKLLRQ